MNSLKTLIPYTDPKIDYYIWPGTQALRHPLLSVVLITATDLEAANHQNLGGTIGTLITTIQSPGYRKYPLLVCNCPLRGKSCKVRGCGRLNRTCRLWRVGGSIVRPWPLSKAKRWLYDLIQCVSFDCYGSMGFTR